jgi:hypothetical protein
MSDRDDGIESLIDAVIDGRCDEAGLRRFADLVRDDPGARRAYLDQVRMHALLEWQHGQVELPDDRAEPRRAGWWDRGRRRWGLAAVLLIGLGLVTLSSRGTRRWLGWDGVATLAEARNVVWAEGQAPIALNTRLRPGAIRCVSGTLGLAFDTGARVALEGPADVRVVSGMKVRVDRGRVTARVGDGAKGFTVETPSALVVDRGTEFGVEVDASGRTLVVVFRGAVDLSRNGPADSPTPAHRLVGGDAVRVDPTGPLSRVVVVERRPGDDAWSVGPTPDPNAVIRSVRDNVQGPGSSRYYQIVRRGLDDDAPAYVDRPHEWNGLDTRGLPGFLRGADYVMPYNDAKRVKDLEITVEVARNATLYVFFDDREAVPSWLSGRFTDTGVKIGLDEASWPDMTRYTVERGPGRSINTVFSVWKRDVGRDEPVTLGAMKGAANHRAMYGFAAVARP